jgi:malate dehydrogenase
VSFLKTGSAYYAPSAAAAKMVTAVLGDTGEEMPVCAWVDGQYGVSGVYLGVPARIGAGGVTSIVEIDLTDSELMALRAAGEAVREKVAELEQIALD